MKAPSLPRIERNRIPPILDNLPCLKGEVLDIGANWGYFCHTLEDVGFTCYAVENSPEALYFLSKLGSAEGKRFNAVPKSVSDIQKMRYDIVLALSLFHHFLKSKDDYRKLAEFLGKLDTGFMFFEPHSFDEPQMSNAYVDYDEIGFVECILSYSCLNTYTSLGRLDEDGRGIYLLKQ
jgi:cyclopropane fatty-acyl-phospholipid synthase-like methyltransferase